ncbi:MAG: hypothetical protein OXQ94_16005 [Gemmatimonadota bacterium]|nr:hypothetical protein [Gemmatimonadota bacterium]MDE2873182.1 hypothetical protein [Gemmatimonadota bacterium]
MRGSKAYETLREIARELVGGFDWRRPTSWMGYAGHGDQPGRQEAESPNPTTITTVWTWTYDKIWQGDENDKNGDSLIDPPHVHGARWMGAPSRGRWRTG